MHEIMFELKGPVGRTSSIPPMVLLFNVSLPTTWLMKYNIYDITITFSVRGYELIIITRNKMMLII